MLVERQFTRELPFFCTLSDKNHIFTPCREKF